MILEEFVIWQKSIEEEIKHISSLLSQLLSDEPMTLIGDLTSIEVWNARCQNLLAQANSWLDRCRFSLMPQKEEGKSEADRKAEVDNAIAPVRLMRDTLESFCDAIKQRLILGESVLSFHKSYVLSSGEKAQSPKKEIRGGFLY